MKERTCKILGAAACLMTSAAAAAMPNIVASNIFPWTHANVPGLGSVRFLDSISSPFDRIYVSPNGNRWIFRGLTNSLNRRVIVTGQGLNNSGAALVVQEGVAYPSTVFSVTSLRAMCGVNDTGQVAFSLDQSGNTASDDMVFRTIPGNATFDLIAQEGTQAVGQTAGIGYGISNNSVNLLNSGQVDLLSLSLTGTVADAAVFQLTNPTTGSVLFKKNVSVPSGQLVNPSQTIESFTSDAFRTDADGTHTLFQCDLNGPTGTDFVVVKDGGVIMQEGVTLPGSGYSDPVASGSGAAPSLSARNGHTIIKGWNQNSGLDWVYVDGAVRAERGQPIIPNSSELWTDSFWTTSFNGVSINSGGHFVVSGFTNNSSSGQNEVIVYDGRVVLAREGDRVDLNQNGLPDDNCFLGRTQLDTMTIGDNGVVYWVSDLLNSSGFVLGYGVIALQAPTQISPSNYAINFGVEISAPGVGRLEMVDANSVEICQNLDQEDPNPAQMEVSGTNGNVNPESLTLHVVCRADANDREVFTEFFSFVANDWVGVPSVPITDSDTLYDFVAPGTAGDFVNDADGAMIARITGFLGAADNPTLPCWAFNAVSWE